MTDSSRPQRLVQSLQEHGVIATEHRPEIHIIPADDSLHKRQLPFAVRFDPFNLVQDAPFAPGMVGIPESMGHLKLRGPEILHLFMISHHYHGPKYTWFATRWH